MRTVRLGKSGLEISGLVLGMMSYGDPERGGHPWSVGISKRLTWQRNCLSCNAFGIRTL